MILKGFTLFIQYVGGSPINELSKGLCELLHLIIQKSWITWEKVVKGSVAPEINVRVRRFSKRHFGADNAPYLWINPSWWIFEQSNLFTIDGLDPLRQKTWILIQQLNYNLMYLNVYFVLMNRV